jgi:hypothetical protein
VAYSAGVLLLFARLIRQQFTVGRLLARAIPLDDRQWSALLAETAAAMGVVRPVRLLQSADVAMPIACGILRPGVLLPVAAGTWTMERRRAVLLHELAHVSRRDCLTQTIASLACAVHWFNPLAWWAARQLRVERELACDDRVLASGTGAREYAGHLLEIAYAGSGRCTPALAVGMARPGQLEGRMLAALDDSRRRARPSRRFRLATAACAVVMIGPVSGAMPVVVATPADPDPALVVTRDATKPPKVLPPSLHEAPWGGTIKRLLEAADQAVSGAAGRGTGTWEVRPTATPGVVYLRLNEANSSSGTSVALDQLQGLTAAQLSGAGGPVQFRVRRDAGTFVFTGVVTNGIGAGTFAFEPDAAFPAALEKRGLARPTAAEQYELARHDVGFAFLDELQAQGYAKPALADLVRAGQHGVSTTYVREMGALGYRLGALDPLITLRDHGVTAAYVRQLADLGYKGLTADEARNARDHGVTPEYVRGMRDAGYASLSMADLVRTRDHGVTPEYVGQLASAGHTAIPLDRLIAVRDHGVTPEYVRGMKALGFALSLDALVNARDHGVTEDYVSAMQALGLGKDSVDTLVRLRDHGVTPEYAKAVKALGYEGLRADDLVTLRDHGLTPERIREANGRSGGTLSISELVTRADRGMR